MCYFIQSISHSAPRTAKPVKMPTQRKRKEKKKVTSFSRDVIHLSSIREGKNGCYHCGCERVFNQAWLNHGPTAPPFTCPLLWIPEPLGMSEGGIPTAIGGGAEVYNP